MMDERRMFTVEFLEMADPNFVHYSEDRVEILTNKGFVAYSLGPVDHRFADRGWPPVRFGKRIHAQQS